MNFDGNTQLRLAYDFVEQTGTHVFLTGRAGTGKTTFLQFLRNQSAKRSVVVAPTGVAAINAGGVTIHSFFQIPFGPVLPHKQVETSPQNNRFQKLSKDKINIIRSLDLLIIDEISMVRADLLDGIDQVLRRYRNSYKPFGGVQLLLIGDLQQLPPVVKEEERDLLSPFYSSLFFFGSQALQQTRYVSIELQHIYRQSDPQFISLLNQVRNNQLTPHSHQLLNQRYLPGFNPTDQDRYITLTTHNNQASQINQGKLNQLKTPSRQFRATIEGEFPEVAYPTEISLVLKEGAQVMFVKNDPSPDKRFYNGRIGTIESIEEDLLWVRCPGEEDPIAVTPLTWENRRYTLDAQTQEITEHVMGTFTQYPLKLAWAITIHKSQGLTFEKVIIDARAAFAHGQVYVALSRCKTLEGLVLSSPIDSSSIRSDHALNTFHQQIAASAPDQNQLRMARTSFQAELLEELFDFNPIHRRMRQLLKIMRENAATTDASVSAKLSAMESTQIKELTDVGARFMPEINRHITTYGEAEQNLALQERIRKATSYFLPRLRQEVLEVLEKVFLDSDNKQVKKQLTEAFDRLLHEIKIKRDCLEACIEGFRTQSYLEVRAKSSIEQTRQRERKPALDEALSEESQHPRLLAAIRQWRDKVAQELNVPIYMILPRKSMTLISNLLPASLDALAAIHGMGKKKVNTYGPDIISLVHEYCVNNDVRPSYQVAAGKSTTTKPKSNAARKKPTGDISFDLFMQGKSIEEVARLRSLARDTIEKHLLPFVESGLLPASRVLSPEKFAVSAAYFEKYPDGALSDAREQLGEEFTWSDLRFARAHAAFVARANTPNL